MNKEIFSKTSSKSVQTQILVSSGTNLSDLFRAVSNLQGFIISDFT